MLRIVAGLLRPDAGSVWLDDEDITTRPPYRRDIGVVFQNYALFPHLTVAENIAFGLEARRAARAHRRATVARFLDLVDMRDFADRSVKVLSGGQQQPFRSAHRRFSRCRRPTGHSNGMHVFQ